MKIGVVTASYPRSEGEHAGNFVAAHVAALRAAGHDVEVIGAHTISSPLFYGAGAPDELERGGLRNYAAAARFSWQLTRETTQRAPDWDLAFAHWLAPSALAAAFATRSSRIPIVAVAHGGDVHTLRRLNLLAPTLYALRARGVQLSFVSDELRSIARAAAPRLSAWLDAALVQPMGVDLSRFTARISREFSGAAIQLPPDELIGGDPDETPTPDVPTILVVARLVPIKGVDIAIRAFQRMRTPARLVIAGDGPERARLEQLAHITNRGHASPQIEFLGTVDTTRLDQLLQEASCVVVPSRILGNGRTEGTPMIAIEALATGVPVVASAVGGLRELPAITRVRPNDPQALSSAIERVLAEPQAHQVSAFDLAMFDWSFVSARLLEHALAKHGADGRT